MAPPTRRRILAALLMVIAASAGLSNPVRAAGPDVSEAEAKDFGDKIARSVADGKIDDFNDLLDWDVLIDRSAAGLTISRAAIQQFRVAVRSATPGKTDFFSQLSATVKAGGEYAFLRSRVVEKGRRSLVRLLPAGGGINYHEYVLVRAAGGKVRAIDIFAYAAGEMLSETLRRFILAVAEHEARDGIERFFGVESDLVKSFPTILKINDARAAGDNKAAIGLLETLPASVKRMKFCRLLRVMATSGGEGPGTAAYLAAIDEYRAAYPGDPSIDLISIDGFFLRKQYAEAIATMARVDLAVGGDPYLQALQAESLLRDQKPAAALALARKAIVADPSRPEPRLVQLKVELQDRAYADLVRDLDSYLEAFSNEPERLQAEGGWDEFAKSPEFAARAKRLARKGKARATP